MKNIPTKRGKKQPKIKLVLVETGDGDEREWINGACWAVTGTNLHGETEKNKLYLKKEIYDVYPANVSANAHSGNNVVFIWTRLAGGGS